MGQSEAPWLHLCLVEGKSSPRHVHVYGNGNLVMKWGSGQQESHERRRDQAHYQIDRKPRFGRNAMKIRSVKLNNKRKM
jgi:hypothetical protein